MYHKKKMNSPATKLRDIEHCDITCKEFKIALMKKLNKLKENSERQFNELMNKIKFWI